MSEQTAGDDVTAAIKRQLIDQEIALWRNTRYQHEVRLRVARRIGDGAEITEPIVALLGRCEKALDALREERAALGIVESTRSEQ